MHSTNQACPDRTHRSKKVALNNVYCLPVDNLLETHAQIVIFIADKQTNI